jgi:hypothetical protein
MEILRESAKVPDRRVYSVAVIGFQGRVLIAQAINPLIEGTGSHKLIRVTIPQSPLLVLGVLPGSHLPAAVAFMSIMTSVVTLLRSLQK